MRYDRLTGYFSAGALALAARGIEGLVGNGGHMRLVVGCTLEQSQIAAIERGERLRDTVERHLSAVPLTPLDAVAAGALELLSWMIAGGHLSVKVAVPCADDRTPIPSDGIFHEKAGIIQDHGGHRIAWNGSLNETPSGWRHNWESINVYTSGGSTSRDACYSGSRVITFTLGGDESEILRDPAQRGRTGRIDQLGRDRTGGRLPAAECADPAVGRRGNTDLDNPTLR